MVSLSFAVPPCAVAFHISKEEIPRRFEFLPDEPEAEHPAPEGVSFVLGLLGLGACEAYLLGKLAHGQAKLDHRLEVPRVEPVLLAVCGDEIAGFAMVEEYGGMFFSDNEKHSMIGCVGVTHKYRRRGIGLAMTAEGSLSLYEKNCKDIQLLYVERVAWYNKLGYEVTSRQWMGRKKIKDIIF